MTERADVLGLIKEKSGASHAYWQMFKSAFQARNW